MILAASKGALLALVVHYAHRGIAAIHHLPEWAAWTLSMVLAVALMVAQDMESRRRER